MKKQLIFFAIIPYLLISCSSKNANAEEESKGESSPIQIAYGGYELINSSESYFDYYNIELKTGDIISAKYKVNNSEEKTFESKFTYKIYEGDYFIDEDRYQLKLEKYDEVFPLVNWAIIVLELENNYKNTTLDMQSIGMTSDGDINLMQFNKIVI